MGSHSRMSIYHVEEALPLSLSTQMQVYYISLNIEYFYISYISRQAFQLIKDVQN